MKRRRPGTGPPVPLFHPGGGRVFDARYGRLKGLTRALGGVEDMLPGSRAAVEELALLESLAAEASLEVARAGRKARGGAQRRLARLLARRSQLYRDLGLARRRR